MTAQLERGCFGFSSRLTREIVLVELDDAEALRIVDVVGEHVGACLSAAADCISSGIRSWPKKILSPRMRHTGLPPTKSSPITKAWAMPPGLGCTA